MRIGHYGRGLTAIGTAALLGSFVACGGYEGDGQGMEPEFGGTSDIWDADFSGLTQLTGTCVYDTVTALATVTLTLAGAGETVVLSKRVADSALLVNGFICTGPLGTATTLLMKKVVITGGAGNDVIILDFMNGNFGAGSTTAPGVTVDLAAGTNALKLRGTTGADTVSLGASGMNWGVDTSKDLTYVGTPTLTLSLGAGTDTYTGAGVNGTGTVYTGAVTVYGGEAADILTGGDGIDTFNGGDANDTITGGLGADVLNGDAGDDTFLEGTVTSGGDVLTGGAGTNDTVSYALRGVAVVVTMGAGANDGEALETDDVTATIETVIGSTVGDTLTGSALADTISGGNGADTIVGGDGNDILNGDAGDDILTAGALATDGVDVFNGGAGTDTVTYAARGVAVVVDIDGVADDGEALETDNVKADVENLIGGGGGDTLTGSASANTITGGLGADILNGLAGDDIFLEGAVTSGGDTFNGGLGVDLVDYSLRVAALTITMDGVAADDGLALETDDVKADVENVYGGSGPNSITGNDPDNTLVGNAAADTLAGGPGNDTLEGAAAVDNLSGGAGDDILDGGAGNDVLNCGTGDGDIGFVDAADLVGAVACEL